MDLLHRLADDLHHLGQVYEGWSHLIDAETAFVETDDPALLPLRADRIADEAGLVLWHLERSRTARALLSRTTTVDLHEEAAHWRQCARDLYEQSLCPACRGNPWDEFHCYVCGDTRIRKDGR